MEDNLHWKMTFGGRQPLVDEEILWKTTCGGRRPSLDPCMLSSPLCGTFSHEFRLMLELSHGLKKVWVNLTLTGYLPGTTLMTDLGGHTNFSQK